MISIKRAYEPAAATDGRRFLIDRLWPRGTTKAALRLDAWLKDLAPSAALRRYFQHDPEKWPEFRTRYLAELRTHPAALKALVEAAREGPVTLVYGAREERYNDAVVVREYVNRRIRAGARGGARRARAR